MMWTRWWIVASLVVFLVGCSQPEAKNDNSDSDDDSQVEQEANSPPTAPQISEEEMEMRLGLPDVVEGVIPSVVGITTERTIQQRRGFPFPRSPFGDMFPEFDRFGPPGHQRQQQRRRQDVGSGVIVDESGIVLTNNHVIEDADSIQVNLYDGRDFDTEVVGTDPESDIAVLRITDAPDELKAISFGDSDALRLGESVIAIGNPFGLSGTVTLGIISAKGRADVGILDYENFIQTDAAINPGNSGGALINLDGELVGINTAILTRTGGYQGIGFAIPSNMARMVMEGLREDGEVDRGWLGVVIQQLTPPLREALDIDDDLEGVLVSDVQPGSPAEEHGIERGDLIVEVDGDRVRTPQELRNRIGLRSPGNTVQLSYIRNAESETAEVVLGSLAEARAAEEGGVIPDAPTGQTEIEGLELHPLDDNMRRQFNIPGGVRQGLVVTRVEPNSEAARYNLREGDVIMEINRQSVASIDEFNAAYEADRPRNLFLLVRDGRTIFMTQ